MNPTSAVSPNSAAAGPQGASDEAAEQQAFDQVLSSVGAGALSSVLEELMKMAQEDSDS